MFPPPAAWRCAPPIVHRRRWLVAAAAALGCAVGAPSWAWRADEMSRAAQHLGARVQATLPALQALLADLARIDDRQRLERANRFYNDRVRFRTDLEIWGQVDHWASPLEMLDKGEGDCEDFAIAKYLSLIAGGMDPSRLRLVYVRARLALAGEPPTQQAHMVLAYYEIPQVDPMILDNLVTEILPASQRPDLTPVFSFSAEGLWQGLGAAAASGDPLARLTRWRSVLQRARDEGFR